MEEAPARTHYPHRQESCAFDIYPNGTISDRGHLEQEETLTFPKHPRRKGKGKRSAITSFSKQSASRLRRLLAQTRGPEGWECFGLTLTVPGSIIITETEWRRLWNAFRQKLLRFGGVTLIWRIELQTRTQPHVHCVCWGKNKASRIREYWLDTLDLLGPYNGPARIKTGRTVTHSDGTLSEFKAGGDSGPGWAIVPSRRLLPGADSRAVNVDGLDGKDKLGWWRYLAAHTSKAKQSQFGWKGRQWGKVNGQLLDLDEATSVELPRKSADKVYRCLRRLTNCHYASSHGRQTWFVHPSIVKRLCDWVTGNCQPIRLVGCTSFSPFKMGKTERKERAKAKRLKRAGVPVCGE